MTVLLSTAQNEVNENGKPIRTAVPHKTQTNLFQRHADRFINSARIILFFRKSTRTFKPSLALTFENLMRTLRFNIVVLMLVLAVAGAAMASNSGTTAADFLNLGVGPRAVAMGDAQVGLADDVYSTYWNPAGLSTLHTAEASFVQTQYVENITQEYLAYAQPKTRWGSFGASFTYQGYGSIQGYDAVAQQTGSVGASDMALGLSYSRDLYHDERYGTELSAGLTGKWIDERLAGVNATAFASDFGLLFAPGIKWGEFLSGWKAGVALRNIGSSLTFDQESFSLPKNLSAGLSYTGSWREESITMAVDGRKTNDGPATIGAGVEVTTLGAFVLRGGYSTDSDFGNGLSVGAGLRFKTLQIDYAFGSEGPLGTTQRIGLTLHFAAPKKNPLLLAQHSFEQGMRDYRNGRFAESLADFNKTLDLDSTHPEALDMMKKTYEKLQQVAPE